jgi:hypothetical protein
MIALSTVYHGAVVNPQTLTSYDILPNCLLAVSPAGEIEWIVEDVVDSMVQEIMSQKGCSEAEVISLKRREFIIPGFIDTHTVSVQPRPCCRKADLNLCIACTSSPEHGDVSSTHRFTLTNNR